MQPPRRIAENAAERVRAQRFLEMARHGDGPEPTPEDVRWLFYSRDGQDLLEIIAELPVGDLIWFGGLFPLREEDAWPDEVVSRALSAACNVELSRFNLRSHPLAARAIASLAGIIWNYVQFGEETSGLLLMDVAGGLTQQHTRARDAITSLIMTLTGALSASALREKRFVTTIEVGGYGPTEVRLLAYVGTCPFTRAVGRA